HGRALTSASDVFSVGLVLYEMLTGRLAIQGENLFDVLRRIDTVNPEKYAAELPEPFASILRPALIREPERSGLSMQAIADKLAYFRMSPVNRQSPRFCGSAVALCPGPGTGARLLRHEVFHRACAASSWNTEFRTVKFSSAPGVAWCPNGAIASPVRRS